MSDYDVELLGQKFAYPNSYPAVFAVLVISASITAIIYIIVVLATEERIAQLGNVFLNGFTDADGLTSSQETYSLGFWTPSNETYLYWNDWIEANPNLSMRADQAWEFDPNNDQKSIDFGEALTCSGCPSSGYRRYAVLGRGRSSEQPGFWWVATIRNSFEVSDFVQMYSEFWNSTDSIYVEVVRHVNGSYE